MKTRKLKITRLRLEPDEELEAYIQLLSSNMAKANTEVIYLANEYLRDILLQELTRRDEQKKIKKLDLPANSY